MVTSSCVRGLDFVPVSNVVSSRISMYIVVAVSFVVTIEAEAGMTIHSQR